MAQSRKRRYQNHIKKESTTCGCNIRKGEFNETFTVRITNLRFVAKAETEKEARPVDNGTEQRNQVSVLGPVRSGKKWKWAGRLIGSRRLCLRPGHTTSSRKYVVHTETQTRMGFTSITISSASDSLYYRFARCGEFSLPAVGGAFARLSSEICGLIIR